MRNLNINVRELTKHIELKTDYWVNKKTTNCYAFAMGFDIPEHIILHNAYLLGTIGLTKERINLSNIRYYSYEERLIKDLKALKLRFCEADYDEKIVDDEKYTYFLISLLESKNDFHFLRKSKQYDKWWHKRGWFYSPDYVDDHSHVIKDPKEASIGEYNYVKTYKIGFKRN